MPDLNFTFKTGTLTLSEIRNAFAAAYNYQDNIPNPLRGQEGQPDTIPNPQTKAQFMKARIKSHILQIVQAQRIRAAQAAVVVAAAEFDPTDPAD